jgi:hypothetical protein
MNARVASARHAYSESNMQIKAYADSVGRVRVSVDNDVGAARVATAVRTGAHGLTRRFAHLVEIHTPKSWLWPALVEKMVSEWRPRSDSRLVHKLPDAPKPKGNFAWNRIAEHRGQRDTDARR